MQDIFRKLQDEHEVRERVFADVGASVCPWGCVLSCDVCPLAGRRARGVEDESLRGLTVGEVGARVFTMMLGSGRWVAGGLCFGG